VTGVIPAGLISFISAYDKASDKDMMIYLIYTYIISNIVRSCVFDVDL